MFWRAVTLDQSNFLDEFLALLRQADVRWCLIGGQAVNAYVDPVVSLDLDIVIGARDLESVLPMLELRFTVTSFPHSLNVAAGDSDLRVQIQLDPRYLAFVDRAQPRPVLGIELPVARVEDVLQGKIWAASDPSRRGSKRQKDLADIARLIESHPDLRPLVPAEIQDRLI
jgi:hypothetical protein